MFVYNYSHPILIVCYFYENRYFSDNIFEKVESFTIKINNYSNYLLLGNIPYLSKLNVIKLLVIIL